MRNNSTRTSLIWFNQNNVAENRFNNKFEQVMKIRYYFYLNKGRNSNNDNKQIKSELQNTIHKFIYIVFKKIRKKKTMQYNHLSL